MRSWKLFAAAFVLASAAPAAFADEVPAAGEPAAHQATAESVASPEPAADAARAEAQPAEAAPHAVKLGPAGRDEQGRPGRIHVVERGDTLWDVSDAYLGTPWVWPSIWKDNEGIKNPHLIYPGDRIWITPTEMRKVSAAEAEALLAGQDAPAAMSDQDAVPGIEVPRESFRYPEIQTTGFVSTQELNASATIVDSPLVRRRWLADHDEVVIGLGEGEVSEGDRFEIFRPGDSVADPETGVLFGYATEELGWLEVTAVHPESATGMIRLSRSEIQRGDRVLPRQPRSEDIEVLDKPEVAGRVVFTPQRRLRMGSNDVVYLNRGTEHGLSVGSPLEVYRPLGTGFDAVRQARVALPDDVVAKLLVVDARGDTAVAVVTHATVELERGDRFRGTEDLAW